MSRNLLTFAALITLATLSSRSHAQRPSNLRPNITINVRPNVTINTRPNVIINTRPNVIINQSRPVAIRPRNTTVVINRTVVAAPSSASPEAATVESASVSAPSAAAEAPVQQVRFLKVENNTKETLKVFVKLSADAAPLGWQFEAGQSGLLPLEDGSNLAAGSVLLWAESGSRNWNEFKEKALVLVAQPYQADAPAVHTHRFAD